MPTVEYASCLRFRFHDSAFRLESEAENTFVFVSVSVVEALLGELTKSDGDAWDKSR